MLLWREEQAQELKGCYKPKKILRYIRDFEEIYDTPECEDQKLCSYKML